MTTARTPLNPYDIASENELDALEPLTSNRFTIIIDELTNLTEVNYDNALQNDLAKLTKQLLEEYSQLDTDDLSEESCNHVYSAFEACKTLIQDPGNKTSQDDIVAAYNNISDNKELGARSNIKIVVGAIVGVLALAAAAALTVLTLASAGIITPASIPVVGGLVAAGCKLLCGLAGTSILASHGISATILGATGATTGGLLGSAGIFGAVSGQEKGFASSMHNLFNKVTQNSAATAESAPEPEVPSKLTA